MRIALVANPGSGKQLQPGAIREGLEAHGATVVLCEQGWKGGEETRERAGGADRIVAAGGDGIVAPCAALARDLDVPLAVVPVGTANDFARDQELPLDVEDACRLAVLGSRTRRLELARMADRAFVNAASAGLSPLAAQRAKPLKKVLGPLAYAVGAVAAGTTGRPLDCTAAVDGRQVHDGPAWQIMVAATGAFGAGAEIAEADPRDGRLDLVVVPGGSRAGLPRRALAMRRGSLAGQPGVVHRRADAVTITVAPGTEFNVDGELVTSEDSPLHFSAERAAYELVVG